MENKLLEMHGLRILFNSEQGYLPAVDRLDLEIAAGEAVGLVGESGCGKSISAFSLMGLLPLHGCRMEYASYNFAGETIPPDKIRSIKALRGGKIGMVFQDALAALDPVYTVGEQLTEAVRAHRKCRKDEAQAAAVKLLGETGIPDPVSRMNDYPHQLSGGMRQRVMIAVALINRPQLLIADEPTTALDVTIQAQILRLISELRKREGMAVLFISHDLGVVAEVAERIVVMYAGEAVEQAATGELMRTPLHPYTAGLLSSLPELSGELRPLNSIPGRVPEPAEMAQIKGCRFADRCSRRFELCTEQAPPLFAAGVGRTVRCWLYRDGEGA